MREYDAKKNKSDIKTFVIRAVSFIVLLVLIFGVVFGITTMRSADMSPQIHAGDLILYYRLDKSCEINDVIVTEAEDRQFIGRVAAGPGDEIDITDEGRVMVNGSLVVENDIFYPTPQYVSDVTYPVQLQENEYFVLCDKRNGAKDSRLYGQVNVQDVKGNVITVLRKNNI